MKVIFFALAISCCHALVQADAPIMYTGTLSSFQQWKVDFGKNYDSEEDHTKAFESFLSSVERVATLNKKFAGQTTFAINEFSDMTPEEFSTKMLTAEPPKIDTEALNAPVYDESLAMGRGAEMTGTASSEGLPTAFDWTDLNATTPVKNQGQCGSCWAFSVTETIESGWFLGKKGPLTELAPQQLVDCDWIDQGCNGGTQQIAYTSIKTVGGIDTEANYPYVSGKTGKKGSCKFDKSQVGAKITGFYYATPLCLDVWACSHQDEDKMAHALYNNGPVSICIDAAEHWQDYHSGVLMGADCPSALIKSDHCVQAVGFDFTNSSLPYWIVRNSWGPRWGINGHINLQYGKNTCGIANTATLVNV